MKRLSLLVPLFMIMSACTGQTDDPNRVIECLPDAIGTSRQITLDGSVATMDLLRDHEVVLTYDDGPHVHETQRVLDELSRQCVKATFFLRGDNASRNRSLVRLIRQRGHALGGHSWSHPDLIRLSPSEARDQILRGNQAIENAVHTIPGDEDFTIRLFRFPFLHINDDLDQQMSQLGLIPVWVQADGADWSGIPAEEIVERIFINLERAGGKGVILLHPPTGTAEDSTRMLIRQLKSEGYSIVAINPPEPPAYTH
ncbi:MAG: hypothetical protein CME88_15180 [Hirschia sp.]|nr:hypothetical protein [Hirschia sp.]MBF19720.1 hypothetical protein [Hirschia sp.]